MTILTNVTLSAGTVVTRVVPADTYVGGVPAKIIRCRFDEATIGWRLASKWWHGWDDRIRENMRDLLDAAAFARTLG